MSDSTPTKVLPLTPSESPAFRPRNDKPSRAPKIAFFVVAALVVAGLVVLGDILIDRDGAPFAAPANTAPPTSAPPVAKPASAAPVAPPAPPPAGTFTSFEATTSGLCHGHGRRHDQAFAEVSWSTTDATAVWVGTGPGDAVNTGEQVPLTGTQDSFPSPLQLTCRGPGDVFTMTLVGDDGAHVSRTWTVTSFGHG